MCAFCILRCIEMYGENRFKGSQACMPIVQYMVGCGKTWGIQWHLNYTQSTKCEEVMNANSVSLLSSNILLNPSPCPSLNSAIQISQPPAYDNGKRVVIVKHVSKGLGQACKSTATREKSSTWKTVQSNAVCSLHVIQMASLNQNVVLIQDGTPSHTQHRVLGRSVRRTR